MGSSGPSFVIEVTAITHRRDPIYQAFFSQMPPSESSCIRGTGRDVALLKHLRRDLRLPVRDVHLLDAGGGAASLAISLRREHPALPKRAMWAAWAYDPSFSKWVVVVDEDIDVRDYFQVLWAMSWHVQPEHDLYVNRATAGVAPGPSTAEEDVNQLERETVLSSKVGVDATRKDKFPAPSVPPQEDLDRGGAHWADYGLGGPWSRIARPFPAPVPDRPKSHCLLRHEEEGDETTALDRHGARDGAVLGGRGGASRRRARGACGRARRDADGGGGHLRQRALASPPVRRRRGRGPQAHVREPPHPRSQDRPAESHAGRALEGRRRRPHLDLLLAQGRAVPRRARRAHRGGRQVHLRHARPRRIGELAGPGVPADQEHGDRGPLHDHRALREAVRGLREQGQSGAVRIRGLHPIQAPRRERQG